MRKLKIVTHTRPDVDAVFATYLILERAKNKAEIEFIFLKGGDENLLVDVRNSIFIDRGEKGLDHHGKGSITSTHLAAKEVGLVKEKWMQPILRYVYRVDLKGKSEPFDVNDILKALGREKISDEEIMQIGLKIAHCIFEFHRTNMQRDNAFALKVMRKYLKEKKKPERFKRYMKQLENPRFQRKCDFTEIMTASKEIEGKEKAEKFGKILLDFLYRDFEKFEAAKKEVLERAQILKLGKYTIVAGISDNPKFNPAARLLANADIIIQRNSDGHCQIYFNCKKLKKDAEKLARKIVKLLRTLEAMKSGKKINKNLEEIGKLEEIPEWYFFMTPEGCPAIFNGSLTAPLVPITKISLNEIIEIVKASLQA